MVKPVNTSVIGKKEYRLLLCTPNTDNASNPTVELLLRRLVAQKYHIDIMMPAASTLPVINNSEDNGKVKVYHVLKSMYVNVSCSRLKTIIRDILRIDVFIIGLINSMLLLLHWLSMYIKRSRYHAIIGIDPAGIIMAYSINLYAKAMLVYISFEMFFKDEARKKIQKSVIEAEETACGKVDLFLIQDEERKRVFCKEKNIVNKVFIEVPVSLPFMKKERNSYLHNELGIQADRKIVLYSGSLTSWAGMADFEHMVKCWKEEFVLVIHARVELNNKMCAYKERLEDGGKIYFTHHPLNTEEYITMVSSADIGLAPYHVTYSNMYTGKNLYHIGLASGKIAIYAMCGLPVLANDLPSITKEFKSYKCGLTYQNSSEIGHLIEIISFAYESFSRGASLFYKECLDPLTGMSNFLEQLKSGHAINA